MKFRKIFIFSLIILPLLFYSCSDKGNITKETVLVNIFDKEIEDQLE